MSALPREGYGSGKSSVFGRSGAGLSPKVLVAAVLASLSSSSKLVTSRREASLSVLDLTGSCWNVSSTNRELMGGDIVQELFESDETASRNLERTGGAISCSSERVGSSSGRSGACGSSGLEISSGPMSTVDEVAEELHSETSGIAFKVCQ